MGISLKSPILSEDVSESVSYFDKSSTEKGKKGGFDEVKGLKLKKYPFGTDTSRHIYSSLYLLLYSYCTSGTQRYSYCTKILHAWIYLFYTVCSWICTFFNLHIYHTMGTFYAFFANLQVKHIRTSYSIQTACKVQQQQHFVMVSNGIQEVTLCIWHCILYKGSTFTSMSQYTVLYTAHLCTVEWGAVKRRRWKTWAAENSFGTQFQPPQLSSATCYFFLKKIFLSCKDCIVFEW